MSETRTTLALSAGLGLIAGMRSMAAPALLSRHLAGRSARGRGAAMRLLASRRTASVLTVLAAGEMVADKTPAIPDRTDPPALLGRIVMGALSGAADWGEPLPGTGVTDGEDREGRRQRALVLQPRAAGQRDARGDGGARSDEGRLAEAVGGDFSFTMTEIEAPDVTGRLLGRPFEATYASTGASLR